VTFDEPEHDRWVRAAGEHLAAARHAEDGGFHAAAVLHAEQATQATLKALLHGVGVPREARGHDLLALSVSCEEEAGLVLGDPERASLAELGRQYQATRYPDALPSGTPGDWFGPEAAVAAIATAERIAARAGARWSELLDEAGDRS